MTVRCLCVGVRHFGDEKFEELHNAESDAKEFGSIVSDLIEFDGAVDLRLLSSPTLRGLEDGLKWLYMPFDAADTRIFYISTHGHLSVTGTAYLVCSDSIASSPTSMLSGQLLGEIAGTGDAASIRSVWILDCCHAESIVAKAIETLGIFAQNVTALMASNFGHTPARAAFETADVGYGTYSQFLSPFTRGIAIACRGVAAHLYGKRFRFEDLIEIPNLEAIRTNNPMPAIFHKGIGPGPLLQLAGAPRTLEKVSPQLPFHYTGSSESDTEQPRIVCGSDGIRTIQVAIAVADGQSRVVDGRSRVGFGVSIGNHRATANPNFIAEALSSPSVLAPAENRTGMRVMIVDPAHRHIIPSGYEEAVIDVPVLTEDEIFFEARRVSNDFGLKAETLAESVACETTDSLELLRAKLRVAAMFGSDRKLDLDEALSQTVSQADAGSNVKPLVSLMASVPGVFLPIESMAAFTASKFNAEASVLIQAVASLSEVSIVDISRNWCRVIEPVISSVGFISADYDLFVEYCLRHYAEQRGRSRQQLLCAIGRIIESEIARGTVSEKTLTLIELAGRDFVVYSPPDVSISLLADVRSLRNDDLPSRILGILADAYRLADQYEASRVTFQKALSRAKSDDDKALAKAGLVSGQKSAMSDPSQLEDLEKSARGSSGSNRADSEASRNLAYLMFQRANLMFGASDWLGAESMYSRALDMLDWSTVVHDGLYIDILKGIGDIALHRDDMAKANEIATLILDKLALSEIAVRDPRCDAKVLQYLGDVNRRSAIDSSSKADPRKCMAAESWYRRSIDEYESQRLTLGQLMSSVKLDETKILRESSENSLSSLLLASYRLSALRNPLWLFRVSIMVVLLSAISGAALTGPVKACFDLVLERVETSKMSIYQLAWGKIALHAVNGSGLSSATDTLRDLGAAGLAARLDASGVGRWLFGFY
ncbi:hypothetical protein [Nocardia beijingensis]